MHEQLASWVKQRKEAQLRMKVYASNSKTMPPRTVGELTEDQRRAAEEYERTGKIPRMTTEGREPFTLGRAGYLRFRKIYSGWDSELISAVPPVQSNDALFASESEEQRRNSATG
jgi:hypothetical protein